MNKQITYVIVNEEGEMFAGQNISHTFWTLQINMAKLFSSIKTAKAFNGAAKGEIMKMKYELEKIENYE